MSSLAREAREAGSVGWGSWVMGRGRGRERDGLEGLGEGYVGGRKGDWVGGLGVGYVRGGKGENR